MADLATLNQSDVVIITSRVIHAQVGRPVPAFAVAGEHIVATGTVAALREHFPRATVEDFGSATIVPGFNDAHIHIGLTAEDLLHQRITPAEALHIYTIGSATASGDEHHKGRLAPGFLADFTILDQDPLTVTPTDITTIKVQHTYVAGRRVWTAIV